MTVRHEDVAVCANGHTGRAIEQARSVAAHTWLAKCHQQLSLGTDLEERLPHHRALRGLCGHAENRVLVVRIGCPDVAVPVHGEPMRMREEADAQASEQSS